ncbi:MAG TPA: hypothetical protein VKS21_11805 [Spirochaetota bacterium]|nr:hypothetical protein [Spirochaetota bacterium]
MEDYYKFLPFLILILFSIVSSLLKKQKEGDTAADEPDYEDYEEDYAEESGDGLATESAYERTEERRQNFPPYSYKPFKKDPQNKQPLYTRKRSGNKPGLAAKRKTKPKAESGAVKPVISKKKPPATAFYLNKSNIRQAVIYSEILNRKYK